MPPVCNLRSTVQCSTPIKPEEWPAGEALAQLADTTYTMGQKGSRDVLKELPKYLVCWNGIGLRRRYSHRSGSLLLAVESGLQGFKPSTVE
jgi:hypothetical protein